MRVRAVSEKKNMEAAVRIMLLGRLGFKLWGRRVLLNITNNRLYTPMVKALITALIVISSRG